MLASKLIGKPVAPGLIENRKILTKFDVGLLGLGLFLYGLIIIQLVGSLVGFWFDERNRNYLESKQIILPKCFRIIVEIQNCKFFL